jgi:site-specific DNA-methyltransferase (adenine-specific)
MQKLLIMSKNETAHDGIKEHPFHSLCSYLGRFPPSVPRRVFGRWVPLTSTVLDPFCGAGTTLVEAVLRGNKAIGVDLNPLAVAISRAKMIDVDLDDIVYRITELANEYNGADLHDVDNDIRIFYHPRTLAQLVYLRTVLDPEDDVDTFIIGVLLGIMHGKHRKTGGTAYLSIDMPNTFSMSPKYVRKFVEENDLRQPPVDVFGKLRERCLWLFREDGLPSTWKTPELLGDATQLPELLKASNIEPVDAIVTSPPYLGILRYGAFNWMRLWLLGLDPYSVDRQLDGTDSLDRYLSFMSNFLSSASRVLRQGGIAASN